MAAHLDPPARAKGRPEARAAAAAVQMQRWPLRRRPPSFGGCTRLQPAARHRWHRARRMPEALLQKLDGRVTIGAAQGAPGWRLGSRRLRRWR